VRAIRKPVDLSVVAICSGNWRRCAPFNFTGNFVRRLRAGKTRDRRRDVRMGIVLGPTIVPSSEGSSWIITPGPLSSISTSPLASPPPCLRFVLSMKQMKKKTPIAEKPKIDFIGIALLAAGIGSLQYVLERGQSDDWFSDRTILILSIVSATGLISFVYRQLTIDRPMIQLSLLKSRNLAASNILTFAVGFGLFGSVSFSRFWCSGYSDILRLTPALVSCPVLLSPFL